MKIGIIGAGHAGVSATQEAIKYGAEITLFSEEKFLPYYRPRITSVAFRQSGENDIFMHPSEWYSDNKVKLMLETKIVRINANEKTLIAGSGESYTFDKIIITTGAKPIVPPFAKALIQKGRVSPLWTMQDALTIRNKISSIKNIAIVGGGVIGIESALKANVQGKTAGHNAATLNNDFVEKKPSAIAVEVKFKDFELHSVGYAEEDNNKKEEVIESAIKTYRSLIKRNEEILGIQMVGSGKDFITYKKQLKEGF